MGLVVPNPTLTRQPGFDWIKSRRICNFISRTTRRKAVAMLRNQYRLASLGLPANSVPVGMR
jgi:hypothetical protein